MVNYLCMDVGVLDNTGLTRGDSLVIRDVSNQQMNSSDSVTNQSNIIYHLRISAKNL